MLINYLTIALRNFQKNKMASAINVAGLTIGLTSCLLIALYIRHELSYDRFEQKGDRISRVIMGYSFNGGGDAKQGNFTSTKVAPVFKRTFPEVESAVRMSELERVISYKDRLFTERAFMYADSSFFDLFSFRLLQGDPRSALNGPGKVILTQSTARKYFGSGSALGQVLRVGSDSSLYQVTGVIEDCPSNSQIKFDFLASFSSLGENQEDTYWDANYTTYLLLKDVSSRASLQAKLPAFMRHEMQGKGATINFYLELFLRIHLYSAFGGFEPNNSIAYIYILGAVALLILAIAGFTYVNLSTARSLERAREVGVRKVMGAAKSQLFWQFIGESVLLCILSVLLSFFASVLLLPFFNQLTDKHLEVSSLFSLPLIGTALFIMAVVSLLAGAYPALILSDFQPIKVLKGSFKHTDKGAWMRKSLIVFQFVISVFLIVSTAMVQKQLYYLQHKQLGYDRDNIIMLNEDSKMWSKLSLIKTELTANPDILRVSSCSSTPVNILSGYNMRSAVMPENEQYAVTANRVDEDYLHTTGLTLIAGSDLSAQDIKDVSGPDSLPRFYHFILNESAAKQLGWTPEQAIGQKMFLDASRPGIVKGVVRDFHFESLHNAIKPLVLFPSAQGRQLLVKVSGRNLPETITFLGDKWKELVPYRPFEYRFLDEDYNRLYNSEIRLGHVLDLFAGIAIVLACLGLFGLSSYAVQQRVREIGIRKILGASTAHIVLVLSQDFVRLSAVAILLAFPLSFWAVSEWLQDFAYRTPMNGTVFLLAGALTLLLTVCTVSVKAIAAALANPVRHLRSE
jgi:putative ABC transport system permease protein